MKTSVYVIPGYGVPKDMRTDLNYQIYLRSAFNAVFQSLVEKDRPVLVVATGGPTDMFRPYRRTEAGEMVREFRRMARGVPLVYRRRMRFVAEPKSLSTLENFLFTKRWIKGRGAVTVFGEMTRVRRIKKLTRLVWGKQKTIHVVGIDFDASANRYLDPAFIQKKERVVWKFDQWAMRSSKHLRRHHQVFQAKVRKLREVGPRQHVQAVRDWFEKAVAEAPTFMKD